MLIVIEILLQESFCLYLPSTFDTNMVVIVLSFELAIQWRFCIVFSCALCGVRQCTAGGGVFLMFPFFIHFHGENRERAFLRRRSIVDVVYSIDCFAMANSCCGCRTKGRFSVNLCSQKMGNTKFTLYVKVEKYSVKYINCGNCPSSISSKNGETEQFDICGIKTTNCIYLPMLDYIFIYVLQIKYLINNCTQFHWKSLVFA